MRPVKGAKWVRLKDGTEVRVMVVVEGHVVARVKGCMPFLKSEREFVAEFGPKVDLLVGGE